MKPIINNEGWKKAFELYKKTGEYGRRKNSTMDIGDTRAVFKAVRCGCSSNGAIPARCSSIPMPRRSRV